MVRAAVAAMRVEQQWPGQLRAVGVDRGQPCAGANSRRDGDGRGGRW